MRRVFLAIASSVYEDCTHLGELKGAVVDGKNFQKVLLDPSLGDYDSSDSRLLVSPTLSEVEAAIDQVLFEAQQIDCFTLYFAGHGISHTGTYYLCMRDTYTHKLSTTAFPINYIFNVINEKKPLQTNIIIDACEAGGISSDIVSLIKPEVYGSASSPSVCLFGACMRDQGAGENMNEGGIATQELLKYIKGDICVDERWPYLDIVQIGRNVSAVIKETELMQTPVVWGLNLTGISTFSKNPHFQPEAISASDTVSLHTFLSSDLNLIEEEKEKLWVHYLNLPHRGITPEVVKTVLDIVKTLKTKGLGAAKIGAFLIGTAESFAMRVAESPDMFAEIEVMAAFGSAFLPILEEENTEQSFLVLVDRIQKSACKVFQYLDSDLAAEPNTLMSNNTGINDLYILPVRITKILGWIGLITKIQEWIKADKVITEDRALSILNNLAKNYDMSFCCVSDAQAPYLMMFTQMQEISEKNESYLFPVRCYINDFIEREGKITHANVSGDEALTYLICRSSKKFSGVTDLLAQPSEILSVLFDACATADMDDVIDPYMIKIDHLSLNIFIPDETSTFADELIENGTNITMRMGSEVGHGIYVLNDYRKIFENNCTNRLQNLKHKKEILIAMALASFMKPDRVPWAFKYATLS